MWVPRWFPWVLSHHFGITPLLGSHFNFKLLSSVGTPLALRPDTPDGSHRCRLVTLGSHLNFKLLSSASTPLALRPDTPDGYLGCCLVALESHLFWDPISSVAHWVGCIWFNSGQWHEKWHELINFLTFHSTFLLSLLLTSYYYSLGGYALNRRSVWEIALSIV